MEEHKPQTTAESEESEEIEDVKVCDICGDAGQEELLAICSKCTDGAEHTYCMRTKLQELPEGEWLCEECKLKEETECADKSQPAPGDKEVLSLNGNTSNPKLLQGSDTKVHEPEVHRASKEVDMEIDTNSSKKVPDSSGVSIGAAISKAKSVLSRGSSFSLLEARKLKQAQPTAAGGEPLSKSASFNNTNVKPKVKQLLDSIPQKQIIGRESVSSDPRKVGVVKNIIESVSFKSLSSGCFNADNNFCPNAAVQRSEPNVINRSLDTNISGSEAKKSSNVSKGFGGMSSVIRSQKSYQTDCTNNVNASSRSIDRPCSVPNTVLQWPAPAIHRDDKVKDSNFSNIPKKEASGGSRILHCKKCNEVGHTTQHCSIDKLHMFALKPSADRNLKEGLNKSSKWKDAIDANSPRFTMQKNIRLPNHSAKSSTNNTELNCGLPSNDLRLDSAGCQNIVRTSTADPSKATAVDVNLHAVQQVEVSCSLRTNDFSDSNQMKVKSFQQPLTNKASVLQSTSQASVIPELEFIWQGVFEVLRSGRLYKLCDGVQAHLSTCASPKVLEAATKFPCRLQLEEVTRVSSWPSQFQRKSPEENNIGIFFFAKDIESYEKNYLELLEYMIKNELALKGNVEGAELLVFPSNNLPENSQRWNGLFFLWGVFIGKRSSCSKTVAKVLEKPCGSRLESVRDLPTPSSQLPISPKLYSRENPYDEKPPKVMRVEYTASLCPIVSSGMQMNATHLANGATSSDNFLKYSEGKNVVESSPNRKRVLPTSVEEFSRADENVGTESIFQPDDMREHKKRKLVNRRNLDLNSPMDIDLEKDSESETENPDLDLELSAEKELPKEEASLSLSLSACASKNE